MSEKRFKLSDWCGEQNVSNVIDIEKQTHLINVDVVDLLNEQQATISALKDIFKDIITYSEWDLKKPYCSLRIAVDRKTYYKIMEILNERETI